MNDFENYKLYERISAYMDGESEAPREVERLIETNAEAARLHDELSRLSARMKALPAPDVHPAFATRVVAHVRDVHEATQVVPTWRVPVGKIAALAAAGVLIAIAVWPFRPDTGITTTPSEPGDPVVAEVLRLRNQPDQVLAAQFGSLLNEHETVAAASMEAEGDEIAAVVAPEISLDDAEVAGEVATLLAMQENFEEDDDLFATLDELDATEAEALRAMLSDYDEGGSELL